MFDPIAQGIAHRLRLLRTDLGLTVQDMADEARIPKPTLECYLAGRSEPGALALAAMSKAFCVSIDWLVFGERFQTRRLP